MTIRITAHILLFALAVIVFYLGLGLGLQFNPVLGTLLMVCRCGHSCFEPIVDITIPSLTPH